MAMVMDSSIVMAALEKSLEGLAPDRPTADQRPAIANTSKRETGCHTWNHVTRHQSDEPDPNDVPAVDTAALLVIMLPGWSVIAGRSA